ncbi:hypothetical protein SRABI128_04395 [Microbacterium sp. Bi128]|nr:hypothetical protein SRABI128_04395 [Microbacterium sp. Bi128]
MSVRDLPDRGRVLCHGFIESVTYVPANQVASFIAILIDHDVPAPVSRFPGFGVKAGSGAGTASSLPASTLPASGVSIHRVRPGAQRQRPAGPVDWQEHQGDGDRTAGRRLPPAVEPAARVALVLGGQH